MSVETLQNRLAAGQVVVLDGAFGELARARGVETTFPLWATHALLSDSGRDITAGIHDDYFAAGAHVVTTGTFRAQRRTFAAHSNNHGALEWRGATNPTELSSRAILTAGDIAIRSKNRAANPGARLVAGSHGPLEDSYTPAATPSERELAAEHTQHALDLAASGVDFLAIETIPTIREGIATAKAAQRVGIPYGISFWGKDGRIGEDESFIDASRQLERAGLSPLYLGANCVGLEVADAALRNLRNATDLPIAISANGEGDPTLEASWQYGNDHDVHYSEAAQRWIEAGALIIGGCCGTTPATIRGVAELVNGAA